MANVKTRPKSRSNVSKRVKGGGKVGKHKQAITGFIDKLVDKKTQSEVKITNTSSNNNNTSVDQPVKDKIKNTMLVTDSKLKRKIHIGKDRFLNDSGYIKNKCKDNFKICNDILKNELLICDNNVEKPTKLIQKSGLDNNIIAESKKICKSRKLPEISLKATKYKLSTKRNRSDIGSHMRKYPKKNKKPKKGLFQCDLCQKQFDTKSSIRRHMYLHLDVKTYSCSQCKKAFRKHLYLTAHMTRQHPNWDQHYMCNLCDKPFLLRENLVLHMATHTYTETLFKCIYCKEKFSEQIDLVNHEKKHLVSGLYDCVLCEQSFDCRNKLSMHIKTHLRVKDYICQHCGKEFLRISSMKRHVQICHGGMRIQCAICKKFLKGHLAEHMRTHEKRRPYKCQECGHTFTQSTQLNVHRRSHTGARPYPCRICDRPFSHSNALMLHIRRHTGEKPFECAMCPISFSQLPHMKAHMKKIHGKEDPYRCKKCQQFFKLKAHLENHVRNCKAGDKELTFEEKIEASVRMEEEEVIESEMTISRMRFLLALLLTMIATKEKLKFLGFNKRLIDDLLVESLEAMGHVPCKNDSLPPIKRLKTNIEILLDGTVPKEQMEKFKKENKRTEDILVLLTDEKK